VIPTFNPVVLFAEARECHLPRLHSVLVTALGTFLSRMPISSSEPSIIAESKNARKEIRQETNDIYNRLHSIAEDAAFISRIAALYPNFFIFRM
jgi:hypothetical protein